MGDFKVLVKPGWALLVLCLSSGLAIFANARPEDLGVPPIGIMLLTAIMVMLNVLMVHMVPKGDDPTPPAV